ncbi:MAG: 23S rRNA (pseudouridine(1915)-N(3))-methyltransferase RlmH [Desulfuromonadia bacterium]
MKFRLLWVGKSHDRWIGEGIQEYGGRVRRYHPLEIVEIREEKGNSPERVREGEGERILAAIPDRARVVILDERGDELSSPEFAALIQQEKNRGSREICFVIGGAYGLSPRVRERGFMTLSLSRMTFTHRMIRPFFLEQLYRACTILNSENYHH